jgi:hypothetical protein
VVDKLEFVTAKKIVPDLFLYQKNIGTINLSATFLLHFILIIIVSANPSNVYLPCEISSKIPQSGY